VCGRTWQNTRRRPYETDSTTSSHLFFTQQVHTTQGGTRAGTSLAVLGVRVRLAAKPKRQQQYLKVQQQEEVSSISSIEARSLVLAAHACGEQRRGQDRSTVAPQQAGASSSRASCTLPRLRYRRRHILARSDHNLSRSGLIMMLLDSAAATTTALKGVPSATATATVR